MPADWRRDGIALWLLPHTPRQRGEPAARAHLARALDMPPQALPITRDAQGRPHFIAPLHHLETGWSHSGDALLLALGEDVELGVDVERLRPRPRAMELAHRFYHPEETRWLHAIEDDEVRLLAFVRLWCVKEAVLKTHGQGFPSACIASTWTSATSARAWPRAIPRSARPTTGACTNGPPHPATAPRWPGIRAVRHGGLR